MKRWIILLAIVLAALACTDFSWGQMPTAVITGPKEARPGSLVVLDASESQGLGRTWLLAVSPEPTSFWMPESRLQLLFASPTPGDYTFVLVVAGTNANGGPAVEMSTHTVRLTGPTPPVPPDPPPGPEPRTGPKEIVILRESSSVAPAETNLILALRTDPTVTETLTTRQHRLTILDPDQTGQQTEQIIARLLAAPRAPPLPALYVVAGSVADGPILAAVPLPGSVAEVLEILRQTGG
jgi:hypothetical protein